jgi:spore maturation protein CgeB
VQKELIAFNGVDEMLAKIRYYLDHPGEAEAIRQAGRAKVMAQYTWKQTWPRILTSVIRVKGWEASPVR